MNELKTLHKPNESATQIVINLQHVLTNSYGLYTCPRKERFYLAIVETK